MGNGQVGGNGSVEWTFVHHDALTGSPVVLHHTGIAKAANKGAANTNIDPNNGVELIDQDKKVRGKDPIDFVDIGGRPGLTPGHFVVTLSFADSDEADRAMAGIVRQPRTEVRARAQAAARAQDRLCVAPVAAASNR